MELFSFSFFGITAWGLDLVYCDIELFALKINIDLSFLTKYFILDSFVNYDGYSIFSKRFLPTVVDIMVI